MNKPTILVTHWVHNEVIEYLSEHGEVITNQSRHSLGMQKMKEYAKNVDAIMAFMPDCIDGDFLDGCQNLKVIGAALKGYDNFDVDACTKRGIWFTMVPDHLTIPTAELALGHLIALGRNMLPGDRLIRSGLFPGWRPVLYGRGLAGSTIGILGMGAVGQTLAGFLVPLLCKTLYYDDVRLDAGRADELRATFASIEKLYVESDFLVVALPLNNKTVRIIDAHALDKCKDGVMLVNIGRGSCVDEIAVAEAIERGKVAGYAADVFAFEDWMREDRLQHIPEKLLGTIDKTFFTPHIGSAVDEVRLDIAMEAAVNIVEALQGKRPHGAINNI